MNTFRANGLVALVALVAILVAGCKQTSRVAGSTTDRNDAARCARATQIAFSDAWIPPKDARNPEATVKASVTIASDGKVVSAQITQLSGVDDLDASVRCALENVKHVAPFPAGAKDCLRTFTLNFNFKAKRHPG